ncbi:MAG: hypothetical protein WCJ84_02100 [Candidatus Peregrinibacteria bacterium]
MSDDHFSDFDEVTTSQPISPAGEQKDFVGEYSYSHSREVFSEMLSGQYRTFFIDVKETPHGKLLKISEKSRGGKKSTIMMDGSDVPLFLEILGRAGQAIA